jgi:hypothetical protein
MSRTTRTHTQERLDMLRWLIPHCFLISIHDESKCVIETSELHRPFRRDKKK